MSVPVPNRGSGELEVNTKARALTVYTLKILENKKWFPDEQKAFIAMLQECVIEIQALCWEANNIKVNGNEERYKRRIVRKSLRGEVPRENVDQSFETWIQHISKGNSWNLIQRLKKYYQSLWKEGDKYDTETQNNVTG